MEFVTPIVTPVVDSLIARVKKELNFWFSSSKYVRKMRAKMLELNHTASDLRKKLEVNNANNLVVPTHVPHWLTQVETITKEAEEIPTGGIGCFRFTIRYKAGKGSFDILEKIDDLEIQESKIKWSDEQIPLGMITTSTMPSTSEPVYHDDGTQNMFVSRKAIFERVLKSLELDSNTQKIALCGMGGIGKTTMMKDLKRVVGKRGMFNWVLPVDVGKAHDMIAIQQDIAQYCGEVLTETTRKARADRLGKRLEGMSDNGKNNILVILDNVFEEIDLTDIGLTCPLAKGFKLLITSRDENVCIKMDIETSSILKVSGLEKEEARSLFWETVRLPDEGDLHNIGEDILNRCGGLPLAINTIAKTLKGGKVGTWKNARARLQRRDPKELYAIVGDIFDISYNHLNDEDKSIFVLCGLFPNDYNIPMEELTRYGWGLHLFENTYSVMEARYQTDTSVGSLIHANLLTESDKIGSVRMHDLARAYVLSNFSEFKQASIVSHGDRSEWPKEDTKASCERILLKCAGMSEFPQSFNYPSLSFLKLMNGDEVLKFSKDFHKEMEKLQVMAYDKMKHPLHGVSLCFSMGLRTLCLNSCSLVDKDISFCGDLINLEVLCITRCGIRKLPSTIGKLKKLRLLELTGCVNLRIDDGVFQSLDKLEELYLSVSDAKGISFTSANLRELENLITKLYALEIEFVKNVIQAKHVSFEKLERFKISIGCPLKKQKDMFADKDSEEYSFRNTLKFVSNINMLFKCKINELISRTEELHLSVKDISYLEVISMTPSQHSMFCKLKVLNVFKCAQLTHLFTISVANGLTQLESLTVSSCHDLTSLVSWCDGVNVMELPQLVELELYDLPNFTSIIPNNDISASQPLLSKEVVVPKLSKLTIRSLEKLEQIWASNICSGEKDNVSMLRVIKVIDCDGLVNLFPRNAMGLLRHLEELTVKRCWSIETLFNIDVNETLISMNTCSLRSIKLEELEELREVWEINDENNSGQLIRGFEAVESIHIEGCKKFRNVFTPATANFHMGALLTMSIRKCGEDNAELVENGEEVVENSEEEEMTSISSLQEISEVTEYSMPVVAFQSYSFNKLSYIDFRKYQGVEVVFEIESPSINNKELLLPTTQQQQYSPLPLLPSLERLDLINMDMMSHVWKCSNWNEFFILHQHQTQSSFQNLTFIWLQECNSIKYLFSPLMSKLLSNLKTLSLNICDGMEEVVSNRDDDEVLTTPTTTLFPCLDRISLSLMNMKHIGGGVVKGKTSVVHDELELSQVSGVTWSLCQYSRRIKTRGCHALLSVVPSYAAGQMQKLQELDISYCSSMVEVFETKEINDNNITDCSSHVDQGSDVALLIPRTRNITMHKLPNLKSMNINDCDLLKYTFTFSTLESLKTLEELKIVNCKEMKVIVREEYGEALDKKVVVSIPCLKSIELDNLPNLEGFFVGMNVDFQFPSLDYVKINDCPQMTAFTFGDSSAPKLKYIHTWLGKHNLEYGLNFHQISIPSSDTSSVCPAIAEGTPWSYHNLIEMHVNDDDKVEMLVPFSELVRLQNLEKIQVIKCRGLEVFFEEVRNNESRIVLKFPKLREVELQRLDNVKYLWKSNQWSTLEFPSLTRLSIELSSGLEYVFTAAMVGSLKQLQELDISYCKHMEVIVKEEEECDANVDEIVFPSLKSLKLVDLESLKGFYLGKYDSSFPSMNTLGYNFGNTKIRHTGLDGFTRGDDDYCKNELHPLVIWIASARNEDSESERQISWATFSNFLGFFSC
ncbi:hypothetical protein SSX86_030234 [Deinandra increscens subsp. villosa]|uniref:NB-ARC domain-containing protein n=1 Tax=Deinandra increscens subsp. villosa TaxID=3103831 RepID=A0AAP0CC94_9ASTR